MQFQQQEKTKPTIICQNCQRVSNDQTILDCNHFLCDLCIEIQRKNSIPSQFGCKIECVKCKTVTYFQNNNNEKLCLSPESSQSSPQKIDQKQIIPDIFLNQNDDEIVFPSEWMVKKQVQKPLIALTRSKSVQKKPEIPKQQKRIEIKPLDSSLFQDDVAKIIEDCKYCVLHQQEFSLICKTCKQALCVSCAFQNNQNSHKNHSVIEIKDGEEFMENLIYDFRDTQKKNHKLLYKCNLKCEENQYTLLQSMKQQQKQIQTQFEKLISQIKEIQANSLKQVHDFYQKQISQSALIQSNIMILQEYSESLKSSYYTQDQPLSYFFQLSLKLAQFIDSTNLDLNSFKQNEINFTKFYGYQRIIDNCNKFCQFEPDQQLSALQITQKIRKQKSFDELSSDILYQIDLTNENVFQPIQPQESDHFAGSRVLSTELRNQKTFSILPYLMKKKVDLIYQLSTHGNSSKIMHQLCDGKAPYLLFMEANGYVFGYYMPIPLEQVEKYASSEHAFIFSLKNRFGNKPIKIPIRKDKKHMALYQSKKNPCLGSHILEKQDLFINFDDPKRSSSSLGQVYAHKEITDFTFLAGIHTFWKVKDIEIYHIQ